MMANGANNENATKRDVKEVKDELNYAFFGIILTFIVGIIPYVMSLYSYIIQPSIKISIEDSYIAKKSIISIKRTDIESQVITVKANELTDKLSLDPGPYNVKIELHGNNIYENYIYLKSNENRILKLPKYFNEAFIVSVKLNCQQVYPLMPLPLIIESSKDGYLWIYEKNKDGLPNYIYPKTMSGNKINAGEELWMPQQKQPFIKSGPMQKEEQLLFVVTRKNEKNIADGIALKIFNVEVEPGMQGSNKVVTKAVESTMPIDYGVAFIKYKVSISRDKDDKKP